MYTKPLTRQPIAALDISADVSAIHRLLMAAAIHTGYCTRLLSDPHQAVRDGFGGELFDLSESTMTLLSSIRASTLPGFIQQLDHSFANRLLNPG
jgi:hypothetical protein